jgi:hypothetical protein
MSSFINAEHLKVMLGQESPIEKAWGNYYGLEVLTRGMTLLPYAIERYYPYAQTTEWEMAVIRMIIHCSDLPDGPVAAFKPQDFADRFHLSLRQIRRKIKAMVEKGLLLITPIYNDKGKKTTSRLYDCNPFLDKIFACMCIEDDWKSQHSELLESSSSEEEPDDIDVLSMLDAEPIVPAATASERTSMSSPADINSRTSMSSPADINSRTSMSSPADINSRTSMSSPADINSRTSMSSPADINSRTSMSSPSDITSRTSMSPPADITSRTSMSPQNVLSSTENSTSYVHAHTHALGSNSSSNSNSNSINININTSINTLSSNSNSNSNSNHTKFEIFDTEDDNTGMITTCSDKQCDAEDLQLSSRDKSFNQASTQIDNDARFELWVLDAIEQANRAEDEMSQATEQARCNEALLSDHAYQP